MTKTAEPKHTIREVWLHEAMLILSEEFFTTNGYELPEKLAVSCGFPKAVGAKAIGQCFDPACAVDATTHMFICPSQDKPIPVLGILLHEMIHASVGIDEGHKGLFRKLAKEFGLAGKMTATYVDEDTELFVKMSDIANRLGPYPHAAMRPVKKSKKPGGGGWIRFYSEKEESYKVMVSPKQFELHGAPRDPWGEEMLPVI